MNKKGFTLVELLATIAIIALLTVIVSPSVVAIRKSTLESSLRSKINLINSAAKDYATDNIMFIPSSNISGINTDKEQNAYCIKSSGLEFDNTGNYVKDTTTGKYKVDKECRKYCHIILVKSLIQTGYLSGDDVTKEMIMNPISSTTLNFKEVCIRYDNPKDVMNRKIVTYVIGENFLADED